MTQERRRPGGETSKRVSRIYFICDTSGSMEENGKITELNKCLSEAIPLMQALDEPGVEIQISIMRFDDKPTWVVQNAPIKEFKWNDLENPNGETNIGAAFSLLASEMNSLTTERGFPPLAVVISDGQASDSYKSGLDEYLSTLWGKKTVRRAIGIGKDVDVSALTKFINNPEIKLIQANNPTALAEAIRFVSTVVLKRVSTPPVAAGKIDPDPIPEAPISTDDDVW